jgi:hypothetical protein
MIQFCFLSVNIIQIFFQNRKVNCADQDPWNGRTHVIQLNVLSFSLVCRKLNYFIYFMLISGWIIHRSRWSRWLGSTEMEKWVCWASSRHLKNCFGSGFTEFGSGSRRFGETGSRIQIQIEDFDDQKLKFFVKRMQILFVLQNVKFFLLFLFLDCLFSFQMMTKNSNFLWKECNTFSSSKREISSMFPFLDYLFALLNLEPDPDPKQELFK